MLPMEWTPGGRSNDVEDRRGERAPIGGRGLPLGILSLIGNRFGIGGVVLAILGYVAFQFISSEVSTQQAVSPQNDRAVQFVSFVLDDVQATWAARLPGYRHAKLVLYNRATNTGCGYGDRAVGPFYCPEDERVYLDLDFFHTLDQLGAPGEFAEAYVIAHEIGHHIQKLQGLNMEHVRAGASGSSVKVELQADCYAGIWARSTQQRKLLDPGDLDAAMNAASQIGDDRLQRKEQGFVRPETWTHGSSAQRREWFKRGYDSGELAQCDTFQGTTGGP